MRRLEVDLQAVYMQLSIHQQLSIRILNIHLQLTIHLQPCIRMLDVHLIGELHSSAIELAAVDGEVFWGLRRRWMAWA